jgi:hypothetical protein
MGEAEYFEDPITQIPLQGNQRVPTDQRPNHEHAMATLRRDMARLEAQLVVERNAKTQAHIHLEREMGQVQKMASDTLEQMAQIASLKEQVAHLTAQVHHNVGQVGPTVGHEPGVLENAPTDLQYADAPSRNTDAPLRVSVPTSMLPAQANPVGQGYVSQERLLANTVAQTVQSVPHQQMPTPTRNLINFHDSLRRSDFRYLKPEPIQTSGGYIPYQTYQTDQVGPRVRFDTVPQTAQQRVSTPIYSNQPVYQAPPTVTLRDYSGAQLNNARLLHPTPVHDNYQHVYASPIGDNGDQMHDARDRVSQQSTSSATGRRGYGILPKGFKGGDFISFKEGFENICRINKWDDELKVGHLIWCYQQGPAEIIISSRPGHEWSYEDLMTAGVEMFGNSIGMSEMRLELKKIKREKGESLPDLVRRIIKVTRQAMEMSETKRFEEERIAFMNAIEDNRPLYYHLDRHQATCKSLSHMLSVAMKYCNQEGASDEWVLSLMDKEFTDRGQPKSGNKPTNASTRLRVPLRNRRMEQPIR